MSGQVVVVTGASGGIGRATAVAFVRRGDRVALLARGETGLAAAAEDVRAAGGTPLVVPVDVADAGAEYARVTEVTYLGVVHGTMAALARMRPRDRGVIVQTGSALGRRGVPLQSAYCGAKHAVKGFTEALHTELKAAGSGVRVTRVDLPGVNTPQFDWVLNKMPKKPQPVAPIYAPELMAGALVHAAENPARRAWWVGLPTVCTVLGNGVWPQFMDWYLARTGESGQLTEEDRPADSPSNLWEPQDGPDGRDFGAEGRFGDQQWTRDPQIWASRHHGGLAAAAVAGVAGLLAVRRRR